MDRPALKKLLADIAEGRVNTVVVYKVDRLTRSLADFAKIIEQFDAKGISFVSVTQQFNTTTSMGRLTLNVLLSFAQFEREVTGERIRDKIAASKVKGMWMGGPVPLGYDLRDRKLYINALEAEKVREIFNQYLRLGTVRALNAQLLRLDIRSKVSVNPGGVKMGGGKHYSRGNLYQILRNHLYVGEIEHKGAIYAGEHEGIVDRETWNKVQDLLNQNRQGNRERPRTQSGSLLTGLLFSESGVRYIPTNAQKGGRRYHYYTSQAVIKGEKGDSAIGRLPAPAVERAVLDRMKSFFESPIELLDAMKESEDPSASIEKVLNETKQWLGLEVGLIRSLLHRVIIREDALEIQLSVEAMVRVSTGESVCDSPKTSTTATFSLTAPFRHIPQGKNLKLVIGNHSADSIASREAISKAIARARNWYELIVQGNASGLADVARQQGLSHRYVKNIFPIAFLGPEAVEFLLRNRAGSQPTLDSLMRRMPVRWKEQMMFVRGEGESNPV
jgi:site-specific DNA recombinase